MIQDTSFIVDVLRGEQGALNRLEDIEARNVPEKVAAITVLELHEGIARSAHPEDERQAVFEILASKAIVAADHDIMAKAGRLSGHLFEAGTPIDREDCVVAATALAEDEPVLTGNAAHFERVPDLDVVSY